jgi:DNA primase
VVLRRRRRNMSVIEKIKHRLDIVDVVAAYVTLRRAGRLYRGLCPFHTERNPSFTVDREKQRYRCYGCGAFGDVIDFLAGINNWPLSMAIQYAAQLAGVPLDAPQHPSPPHTRLHPPPPKVERHYRELARHLSRIAESLIPRPRDPEEVSMYDEIWAHKDKLDAGMAWVEDEETLSLYTRGLTEWVVWALGALRRPKIP